MKKLAVIILLVLCVGCGKEEKNLTINIYENVDSNSKESIKVDTQKNDIINDLKSKEIKIEESNNSSSKIKESQNEESNNNSKNILDEAKSWYKDNKEELKEKSDEILRNDVQNLESLYDNAKNWYETNETVSKVKDYVKDEYNSDKDKLIDFWNNITN